MVEIHFLESQNKKVPLIQKCNTVKDVLEAVRFVSFYVSRGWVS